MGIFSFLKRKKPEPEGLDDLTGVPKTEDVIRDLEKAQGSQKMQNVQMNQGNMQMEILKTKIDLVLTELESIKTQNRLTNEKLRTLEKTLSEMKGIRYY